MNCFTVMFVQMTRLILMKIKRPLSRLLDIQLCNYPVHALQNIHHNLVSERRYNFGDHNSLQWLPHYIIFKRNSLRTFRVCVLFVSIVIFVLFCFNFLPLVVTSDTKMISSSMLASLLFILFVLYSYPFRRYSTDRFSVRFAQVPSRCECTKILMTDR